MNLSITRAWDETAAFVKREAGVLFLIVFGLSVLPGLILQAVAQRFVPTTMMIKPGSAAPDMGPFLAILPFFLLALIPLALLSMWGHLTVSTLALRRETVIGSAFSHAARRILSLLGAWLLLFVAALVVFIPVGLVMFSSARTGHWGVAILVVFLFWLLAVFIGVRLLLVTPVAAVEPLGPIAILRRSWALTSGHFWKLLGFLVLLFIVFLVLSMVVGAIGGIIVVLLAGPPTPGSIASFVIQLISGILQAVFLTCVIVMIARIYAQLTGNAASVGEVFE